ncbi:ABC transporter [Trypanosoma theileri]|uniref:ABC transporter n=1 Tax=Trypanosoma theileri TaxID=67003 RepID=A0A1X0NZQ7_9TRYP|nr:ABC transporter [Trypanosoma theileri]ORC90162.1 ABC transporter [Trypanosoma theileri]
MNDRSVDENTPLILDEFSTRQSKSTSLLSSKSVGHKYQVYDAAHQFLRSVFNVGGLTICVVEATVITQSRLSRCFPRQFPSKKRCDAAVALMREGGVHVVADIDGMAGLYLLRVITGSTSCTSGSILANGVPVEAGVFRKAVGVISDEGTPLPNLTVEENINFVVSMRTRITGNSRNLLVKAACVLTELDHRKTTNSLSPSEDFRLRLAMEIVRDPPVIVAYYPFDNLSLSDAAECSAILKRISTILEKTIIISSKTLATYLFEITDTVLLFGLNGQVLYSGETTLMALYYKSLHASITSYFSGFDHLRDDLNIRSESFSPCNQLPDVTVSGGDHKNREDEPSSISMRSSYARETINETIENVDFCGDDALSLAILWGENEVDTYFYASKYYESSLRKEMLRSIAGYSFPPQDDYGVTPFTGTAVPQYSMLKPFLLWWYDALQTRREPGGVIYFCFLLIGLLVITLLVHRQPDDQGGMYNIRGIQFVLFLLTIIANIVVMDDVDRQLRLFFYQRNSGLYNTFCFMFVFVIRTIFLRVICLALFVPVVLFVLKMKALFLLLVGALSITHMFLHVAVHVVIPEKQLAANILRVYMTYCIIFSGFLLNLKSMPPFVGMISLLRWVYGAALAQSLRNMPFSCDGAGNTSYCYSGDAYLELEGFQNESTKQSLVVLGTMCGILILLVGVALACRS